MKLEKIEDVVNGGYDIFLTIGNISYGSYWSSPPKSIEHVGLEYVNGRYIKIKNEKQLKKFKELYKKLWIKEKHLHEESIEIIKKALLHYILDKTAEKNKGVITKEEFKNIYETVNEAMIEINN